MHPRYYTFHTESRKCCSDARYKVHEVLQMLEDADDDDFQGADITILPPAVSASNDTGCDSDDEMVATGHWRSQPPQ